MSPPQEMAPPPTCSRCNVPVLALDGKCPQCGYYVWEPEANPAIPQIQSASVKVMRSHDYCHFEVVLGAGPCASPADVDQLRKTAARLADKAVEQYKVAKENFRRLEHNGYTIERLKEEAKCIVQKVETERTPEEQALLKHLMDLQYQQRRYDYEDDWQEPAEYDDED